MDFPPEPATPPGAWMSPDTTTALPAAFVPRSSGPTSGGIDPNARTVVPLAIRLRPRTPLGVLDAGFDLLGRHWLEIMAVTLTVMVPLVALPRALVTGLSSGSLGQASRLFSVSGSDELQFNGARMFSGWQLFSALMALVATALLGVGISHLVSGWLIGASPTIGSALRVVLGRGWVVVLATMLTLPIRALGFVACLIGLVFVLVWLLAVAPVIALEHAGPGAAIGRSWKLMNRRFMAGLGVVVLGGVTVTLAASVVGGLLGALAGYIWSSNPDALVWAVGTVGLVLSLLTAPLQAIWATLAYFDARVRTEGLDLVLQLDEVFPVGTRVP